MHRFLSVCLYVCLSLDNNCHWLHSKKRKIMSANYQGIVAVTGRAHCQRQVAFYSLEALSVMLFKVISWADYKTTFLFWMFMLLICQGLHESPKTKAQIILETDDLWPLINIIHVIEVRYLPTKAESWECWHIFRDISLCNYVTLKLNHWNINTKYLAN